MQEDAFVLEALKTFKHRMLLDHSDTCSLSRRDAAHRDCAQAAPATTTECSQSICARSTPLWALPWFPPRALVGGTRVRNCLPRFNQFSLAKSKSASQAFSAQIHLSFSLQRPQTLPRSHQKLHTLFCCHVHNTRRQALLIGLYKLVVCCPPKPIHTRSCWDALTLLTCLDLG